MNFDMYIYTSYAIYHKFIKKNKKVYISRGGFKGGAPGAYSGPRNFSYFFFSLYSGKLEKHNIVS